MPYSKNPRPTRFGRQPLADLIARNPGYGRIAARLPGNPHNHLRNTAVGWTRPSDVLREHLPRVVSEALHRDLKLEDLYTPDVLAARHRPSVSTKRAVELEEYVRELVENAPELRPETRDKLAALLRGEAS